MCSSITNEWLQNAKERYLNAKRLSDNVSENDTPKEPFKSKYAAQNALKDILDQIQQFDSETITANDCGDSHGSVNSIHLIEILLNYEIGSIAIDTEEPSNGERHLEISLKILNDYFRDNLSCVLLYVVTYNQLGYLWCGRGEYERAFQMLSDAESLYNRWNNAQTNDDHRPIPFDFVHLFSCDPYCEAKDQINNNALKNLEKAYTLTLYFLAQAYEKCGQNSKSAAYCHATLKRQYHGIEAKDQTYDVIDWALNAGTLSQYFAITGDFNAARHHIACSKKVLAMYSGEDEERFKKSTADLQRIIAKYSIILLESSHESLSRHETLTPVDYTFRPFLLNEPEVEEFEKQMKAFPILGYNDARQVFMYAVENLNNAKTFYTLNEYASDYIECIRDQSKLYMFLSNFERDYERRCKMQKRRIDLLEDILKEINIQYFLPESRQIMYELGEVYSQMVELKLALLNNKQNDQKVNASKKVNSLIQKGIDHYNCFVKTFNEKSTNSLPEVLPDDYARPILLSYFSIGRFYSKIITMDPNEELKNWTKCEEYYENIKDYVKKNSKHESELKDELPLLEEMLKLIPGKKQIILTSTMY